jgi:chemotaxis signal transduction protein
MSDQRKRFDWRKIHDDLALRLAGFAATYEHDPVRVARLLEERTLRLAQAPAARGAGATLTRILVFTAGNERFGLGLEWVQEICPLGRIASLPGVSSALVGLINWRGEFVVVFDAARRLGSAPATQTSPRHAIVLRGGEPRLALAVGDFEGLVRIDVAQLQPPEQLGLTRHNFFKGMSADAVLVLDGDRLIGSLNEDTRAA